MIFNSIEFFIFFPAVVVAYFLNVAYIRKNIVSQILLLSVSLYFYACWKASYLALILISVTITFFSGILMERFASHRKSVLVVSLVSNLAILFFFKYYNFLSGTLNSLFNLAGTKASIPAINVLLPVGISFYTFQALGYSIDVYRGNLKAERNFVTYALFVTFFPQLVAGPIERSENLLTQFKSDNAFEYGRVTDGLKLMAWGLFKKIVISDFLCIYVNGIYNNLGNAGGVAIVVATVFFSIQILCDFSGYSDIAIGVAQVLGFRLMKNFNRPYFSSSIVEFWRNWHISLSQWFKDYIYIPLGGNRKGKARRYLNLLITFMISGIWHGANHTFVLWGLIHGLYQVIGLSTKKIRNGLWLKAGMISDDGKEKTGLLLFRIFVTYVLVCFAWIFFRANSISDIGIVFEKMALIPSEVKVFFGSLSSSGIKSAVKTFLALDETVSGFHLEEFAIGILYIMILFAVDFITRKKNGILMVREMNVFCRWILYVVVIFMILNSFFNVSVESQFIYFQF